MIQLSDHFTYGKLIRFTLPSIGMMIFMSIYGVVDGYFVSNWAGGTALAAINLAWPFMGLMSSVGFMFGTGGSALIAKTLGEGDHVKANQLFSLFVYVMLATGALASAIGLISLPHVMRTMGADGDLLEQSIQYGNILLSAVPAFMLQLAFQSLFVTAGKPQLGFVVTVAAGLANIVLDYIFIIILKSGVVGAAWGTSLSAVVGGIIPVLYFSHPNTSSLRLGRTTWDGKSLLRGCTNGISELLSQISMSAVGMLFNMQLMRFTGENGVAAFSVIMYVNFVFIATFIGYSVGTSPIAGYALGAGDKAELHSLLVKSFVIQGILSAFMFFGAQFAAAPLATIFVGYDPQILQLAVNGFHIFAFAYLFDWIPFFTSGFFTGLNNGLISAVISVSRTLILEVSAILLLPELMAQTGIWLAEPVAEVFAAVLALVLLALFRNKYGYGRQTQKLAAP